MTNWRRLVGVVAALFSFRGLVALGLSSGVTAGVAGPLAIQTLEAQERLAEVTTTTAPIVEITTTTAAPVITVPPEVPTPTDPAPTTTVAPTTTTVPPSTTVPPTTTTTLAPVQITTTTAPVVIPTLPPVVTTPPEPLSAGLWVQVDPERDPGRRVRLDNVVRGSVFVTFDDPAVNVTGVSFWLDSGADGPATSTDAAAPFDLFPTGTGAEPLETDGLAEGAHSLTAQLQFADGTTEVRATTFSVARTGK